MIAGQGIKNLLKTLWPTPSGKGFTPNGSVFSGPNPSAESDRAQPTVWISITVLALSVFLGLALGYFIGIGIPVSYLLVAFLAVVLGFVSLMKPQFGLLLLVAVIFSLFNEIAVAHYGMPSVNIFLTFLVLLATLANKLVLKREKLVWDNQNLPLLAYGGVLVASVFVAANQERALQEAVLDFAKDMSIYLIVITLITSEISIRHLIWELLIIGMLLGSLSVFQVFTNSYHNDFGGFAQVTVDTIAGDMTGERVSGPVGDPNFYAQMLVMLVPLALYRLWDEVAPALKTMAVYILVILVLTVVFTFSRGGFLALSAVLTLSAIEKKVKPGYIIVGLCILLPLLQFVPAEYGTRMGTLDVFLPGDSQQPKTTEDDSLQFRSRLATIGWRMFVDHPFLGVGGENFIVLSSDYAQKLNLDIEGRHLAAHNFYLQVLAETGLLGFAFFAASILYALAGLQSSHSQLKRAGRPSLASMTRSLQIGMVGYLVTALFLQGGGSDRWLWLWIAIATAIKQEVQRSQKKKRTPSAGRELCVS